jgi:alpha-L-rhamnosidase
MIATAAAGIVCSADSPSVSAFRRAAAVWPAGRERVMNDFAGFQAVVDPPAGHACVLRVTACSFYRAWANGKFLAHGPARAGQGHARVDELDLTPHLTPGTQNVIAIEVTAYNCNTYVRVDEPAFLRAEVEANGEILAATGDRYRPVLGVELPERLRRVQRNGYQRAFAEAYRVAPASCEWRRNPAAPVHVLQLAEQPTPTMLPRNVPFPSYAAFAPVRHVAAGTVVTDAPLPERWKDRSFAPTPTWKAYPEDELEWHVYRDVQQTKATLARTDQRFDAARSLSVGDRQCHVLDFGTNRSGFIGLRVRCDCPTPVKLYVSFDELLTDDGDVNFRRLDTLGAVAWELARRGEYELETIEPYTLRYLRIWAVGGGPVEVTSLYLREYASAQARTMTFACSDPGLNRVFEAARETLAQNAIDLFTDCPSRERAGWLCDAFFAARAGFLLTGNASVERNFLENFLHPPPGPDGRPRFPNLPDGMIGMCYPGDHPNGTFIPQWALWYVLQLEEYLARSGDRGLVDQSARTVDGVLAFWQRHENADGLAERLPGWNFIEWSKANEFTQDVNYPSNMLYAAALDAAARLYGTADHAARAARVRAAVLAQSFDGEFFVDNAVRTDAGALAATRNRSEVCQYFAFTFGLATPQSHPQLWHRLVTDFGPLRSQTGAFPDVHKANAIIGNYLRVDLLTRHGLFAQAAREVKAFFEPMAQRTGTLWEHMGTEASCNHGFASHVVTWLTDAVLGVAAVDQPGRAVTVRTPAADLPVDWATATIPVGADRLEVRWTGRGAPPHVAPPANYSVRTAPA